MSPSNRHARDVDPFRSQAGIAYDGICQMIASGELAPGESLSLEATSQRLGMTVTPVRDAMRLMGHQGIIEKVPKYGHRVKRITAQDVRGYYHLREALFSQVARLAAELVIERDIAVLSALARKVDALFEAEEYDELFLLERRFHERLAEIGDCAMIQREVRRLALLDLVLPAVRPTQWTPHAALVEALRTRDPECCDREMRRHVRAGLEDALEGLARQEHAAIAVKERQREKND